MNWVDEMVSKEEILLILAKYGMDSKYQAPYLYEEGGRYGILYSFTHPFYGFLERVKWYQKYRSQFSVQIELDDYETMTPQVQFRFHDKDLSKEMMMQMLVDPNEMPKAFKKQRIYQRLLRTSRLLIAIIELLFNGNIKTSHTS